MAVPIPTVDQVLDSVFVELNTMSNAPGTVIHWERNLEDESEFVETYQDANGELSLTTITCRSTDSVEGPASNEDYEVYSVRVKYYSVSTLDPEEWSRMALMRAQLLVNELEKNTAVFRIGGQVPLRTPETVNIESFGFESVGDKMMFVVVLALSVEARRWS